MSEPNTRRERRFITLRLLDEDRDLIQNLAKGRESTPDRHAALSALVPFVRKLSLPDIREQERSALRVGIPAELEDVINEVAERTGQPFVAVFLAAAREYRKRYPLKSE